MPASSSRTDPGRTAEVSPSPAVNTTPAPNPEVKRWFSLKGGARAKEFAVRLKANAQWVMQFLHGGK